MTRPSQRREMAWKAAAECYVERYNRTVRHAWLDQYIIESIEEAQEFATQWLWTYNNERPNMGIGGITPAQKLKMARELYCRAPVKAGTTVLSEPSSMQLGTSVPSRLFTEAN